MMRGKDKKVFLSSVVILSMLLFGCGDDRLQIPENNSSFDASGETTQIRTTDGITTERLEVRFFGEDDKPVCSDKVEYGKSVHGVPVINHPSDAFFAGWDAALDNIRENKNVHAKYDSVKNIKNAVGFDSVYVRKGEEFGIIVSICGNVEFAGLELELMLGDGIEFVDICRSNDASVCHYSKETHEVFVAMAFGYNVTADTEICEIKCIAGTAPISDDAVKIKVNDIAFVNDKNDIVDAEHSVFNEKIIIY